MSADATFPRVQLHDGWLRLHFSAAPPDAADFHYQWLRSQCEKDRHPLTRERIVDASEIAAGIRPLSASAAGRPNRGARRAHRPLDEPGARTSRYALDWLRQHAYAINQAPPMPPPSTWKRSPCKPASMEMIAAWRRRHAAAGRKGAVVVRGYGSPHAGASPLKIPEALIAAFAAASLTVIGTHFGRIEDLRTDNTTNQNTDQLGYTDSAIEAHTDQPFLGIRRATSSCTACGRRRTAATTTLWTGSWRHATWRPWTPRHSAPCAAPRSTSTAGSGRSRAWSSRRSSASAKTADFIRYSYFTMAPQKLPFAEMDGWFRAYRRFAAIVRDPAHRCKLRLLPATSALRQPPHAARAHCLYRARWVRGVYSIDPRERRRQGRG